MRALTCSDVEAQIDLHAAGECSAAESAAISRHLEQCERCAQTFREAQQAIGLLDAHSQQAERLERLHDRLEVVRKSPPRGTRILPFFRSAAALAAMLLVVVGLFVWLHRQPPGKGELIAGRDDARASADRADLRKWSRSVLGEAELRKGTARSTPDHEKVLGPAARDGDPGEVVFWSSPHARWKATSPRRIELAAGALLLSVRQDPGKSGTQVEVLTRSGAAATAGGAFFIEVQIGGPRPAQDRKPGGKGATQMVVIVLEGQVKLVNPFGTVTGSRGDRLSASEKAAPKK
jgi:hypothetical protein